MKKVIKLTEFSWDKQPKSVLIGLDSIIKVEEIEISRMSDYADVTRIQSRGAMMETTYVIESIEEIFNLINN